MSINLTKPLDDTVISNVEKHFLRGLQANILKGHGREHVALLFLQITDPAKALTFLRAYPVTDAFTQLEETKAFKATRAPGGVVRLVFFTKAGLDALGHGTPFGTFGAFSSGMAADAAVLDGGTTGSWQAQLKSPAHVMLLVAYHDEETLARIVGKMVEDFAADDAAFRTLLVQEGRAYKNGDGEGIEHFGYVDGRSQPLMMKSDIDRESGAGGIVNHDPSAPLGQFILADPLGGDGFGSFFVFRKLEQDVAGFKAAERHLSGTLSLVGDDRERAGAQIVGRFEDGTPLTTGNAEAGVPVRNDFNYSADGNASRCPFQGHIRKTHPRGSSPGGLAFDNTVQMARRGITYGHRLQDPDSKELIDQPNDGVGLLFMSYQSSIESQFHFMQTKWANNEGFPSAGVGIDPVIGQVGTAGQSWFPTFGSTASPQSEHVGGFVKLKGGDYFFAPSIGGLQSL
jgi:Dyp-type peroxidase family